MDRIDFLFSTVSVVETLPQKNNIRKGIVDCKDDHRWEHTLEDGTDDVEYVSKKPKDDEEKR